MTSNAHPITEAPPPFILNPRQDRHSLILLFIVSLLAGWPLLLPTFYDGHDTFNHLWRISQFYQTLREGFFPVRWLPDLMGGYGVPVFVFIPPLSYLLACVFKGLGCNMLYAYKMVMLLSLFLSGVSMFYLARQRWPHMPSVLVAAAYICIPYRLVDMHVRGAMPESMVFVFLPLVLLNVHHAWKLPLGSTVLATSLSLAGMVLTHNMTALPGFAGAILLAGFYFWRQRQVRPVLGLGLGWLLGLGLSAFYWFPALWEQQYVMMTDPEGALFYNWREHFIAWWQFLTTYWDYGPSVAGVHDGMPFQLGTFVLLSVASTLFLLRIRAKGLDQGHLLLAQAGFWFSAFMASSWSAVLWSGIPLISFFQFPWRWLALTTFFAAWLMGFWHDLLQLRPAWARRLGLAIILAPAVHQLASLLLEPRPESLILIQLVVAGVLALVLIAWWESKKYSRLWVLPLALIMLAGMTLPLSSLPLHTMIMPKLKIRMVKESDYRPERLREMMKVADFTLAMLPINVKEIPEIAPAKPVECIQGQGDIQLTRRQAQHWSLQVKSENPLELQLNLFYYPGWTIEVNGQVTPFTQDKVGRMHLKLPAGIHTVDVVFRSIPERRIAERISSLCGLLVALLACVWGWQRWKGIRRPLPAAANGG